MTRVFFAGTSPSFFFISATLKATTPKNNNAETSNTPQYLLSPFPMGAGIFPTRNPATPA
jgi:hypothetical protein